VAPRAEILTIGHSNHDGAEFLGLLRGAEIEVLVDVRANPRSRYPQFNGSRLSDSLKEVGLRYVQLGPQLGGRREPVPDSANVALPEGPFRGYADHMQGEVFADGIARLEALAGDHRAVIMCAEADWRSCHRRMISDALLARGGRVLHLGPDGSISKHELTDSAVADGEGVIYPEPQTSLDV
jgi:uncharacterized protein (DUF488 family)